MSFKNIYIHEGRLFVCFVPMVYETKVNDIRKAIKFAIQPINWDFFGKK
jgi:hypothetical protein